MSTTTPAVQETDESHASKTRVGDMVVVKTRTGVYNVANHEHGVTEAKEHTYSVLPDAGCTCPAAKYHFGECKHEKAVATVEARDELVARESEQEPDERVTGPYTGYDKYGNVDHTYWRCEYCGAEATDKRGLDDCCQFHA